MTQDPSRLSLRNALLRWCFGERVEDVRAVEGYFRSQDLAKLGWPNLGGASNRGEPNAVEDGDEARAELSSAWRGLLLDFQQRVERGQIHLRGVQTKPERRLDDSLLPGQWAAEYRFDVLAGSLQVGEYRFVNVVVLPGPADEEALAAAWPSAASVSRTKASSLTRELRVEDVAQLDPNVVAALLERHAEHVRTGLRKQLLPPGGASPMALIASMMQHRAKELTLLPTMAAEADWLSEWCGRVAPSYFSLGAKRIQNTLGALYKELLAARKKSTG